MKLEVLSLILRLDCLSCVLTVFSTILVGRRCWEGWVLAAANTHPDLLTYTDNIRQLEGLAGAGVLGAATAQWLTEAYIGYRTVLHHLSLEGQGERVVEAAPYAKTRARVVEIWRETFEEE